VILTKWNSGLKARIFQKGAEKRGKLESVTYYQSLIDTYTQAT
jgi:hypothetical protein